MNKFISGEYNTLKRDLGDVVSAVIVNNPVLTKFFSTVGKATQKKHEWLEQLTQPKGWVLFDAFDPATGIVGDEYTFLTTSLEGLKVGNIITFEKSTGASVDMTVEVTSMNTNLNPNAFTVKAKAYGDLNVNVELDAGTSVKLVSENISESADFEASAGTDVTTEYNFTQIFTKTAKVSGTTQASDIHGIENALNFQVANKLKEAMYEMVTSMIYGQRFESADKTKRTMGGLLYFLRKASGNKVNASGSAINGELLNQAALKGSELGETMLNTIICHPNQVIKISAFNNANLQISQSEMTSGTQITAYRTALGNVTTIISDSNFPKDKVIVLNSEKVKIVPLQNREFTSEMLPKLGDYVAETITGEYTVQFENAGSQILIENLAI